MDDLTTNKQRQTHKRPQGRTGAWECPSNSLDEGCTNLQQLLRLGVSGSTQASPHSKAACGNPRASRVIAAQEQSSTWWHSAVVSH